MFSILTEFLLCGCSLLCFVISPFSVAIFLLLAVILLFFFCCDVFLLFSVMWLFCSVIL